MRLQNKVALITGASHGIGKATALAFAREGADVAFTHLDQVAGAAETARLIEAQGCRAHVMAAELSDPVTCRRIAHEAIEAFGCIDILVNNAGGGGGSSEDLAALSLERWRYTIDLNLTAPLLVGQIIANQMIERRIGGSIINISSVHATRVWARDAAYGVAKAGLDRLTQSMAVEWAPHEIRVNAISPGYINTAENEAENHLYEQRDGRAASLITARRAGYPSEIADVAVFLASDAASYVTGQSILVDGGVLLPSITTADFMRGDRGHDAPVG